MGARLALAIATDGAKGGNLPPDDLRRLRAEATIAAWAPLGAGSSQMLDSPDGALRAEAALEQALIRLIGQSGADLILTHAPNDYHAEHRALSAATLQAAEFLMPVLFMDSLSGTGFTPAHWVDVSDHWAAKEAAILTHSSQGPARFVAVANRQASFRALLPLPLRPIGLRNAAAPLQELPL